VLFSGPGESRTGQQRGQKKPASHSRTSRDCCSVVKAPPGSWRTRRRAGPVAGCETDASIPVTDPLNVPDAIDDWPHYLYGANMRRSPRLRRSHRWIRHRQRKLGHGDSPAQCPSLSRLRHERMHGRFDDPTRGRAQGVKRRSRRSLVGALAAKRRES